MKTRLQSLVVVLLLAGTAVFAKPSFQIVQVVSEIDGTSVIYLARTYTYEDGTLVRTVMESDEDEDGIMDRRHITTFSFDPNGNRLFLTNEVYDIRSGALEARGIVSDEYNSEGIRVRSLSQSDSDADGRIDRIADSTFHSDETGKLVQWVNRTDADADGDWDGVSTFTRTYDAQGDLVLFVSQSDGNLDGTIDFIVTSRYTVDSDGNRTSGVTETDFDGDGTVDWITTVTHKYDRKGNLVTTVRESGNADGLIDGRMTETFYYDRHGNLIRSVREDDAFADGIIDAIGTTTRTYVRANPGKKNLPQDEFSAEADGPELTTTL